MTPRLTSGSIVEVYMRSS